MKRRKLLIVKEDLNLFEKVFEINLDVFSIYFDLSNIYVLSNNSIQGLNFIERKNHLLIDILNSISILKDNVFIHLLINVINPLLIEEFLKLTIAKNVLWSFTKVLNEYDFKINNECFKINDLFFFKSDKYLLPIQHTNQDFKSYIQNFKNSSYQTNYPTLNCDKISQNKIQEIILSFLKILKRRF